MSQKQGSLSQSKGVKKEAKSTVRKAKSREGSKNKAIWDIVKPNSLPRIASKGEIDLVSSCMNKDSTPATEHDKDEGLRCNFPDCGRIFAAKAHLKTHQMSHKFVKPHKCDYCAKSFCKIKKLRLHLAIHVNAYMTFIDQHGESS